MQPLYLRLISNNNKIISEYSKINNTYLKMCYL